MRFSFDFERFAHHDYINTRVSGTNKGSRQIYFCSIQGGQSKTSSTSKTFQVRLKYQWSTSTLELSFFPFCFSPYNLRYAFHNTDTIWYWLVLILNRNPTVLDHKFRSFPWKISLNRWVLPTHRILFTGMWLQRNFHFSESYKNIRKKP